MKKVLPQLIAKDTKFRGEEGSYELNFKDALVLTFFHESTGMLFTTIRRRTDAKDQYYSCAIGQPFTLKLTKEK
jgi:hypothetical protein